MTKAADKLAAALRNCRILAYNCHRDELPSAIITMASKAIAEYDAQQPAAHPAAMHCDTCGCDWLDNGLNPVGCPYCKQSDDAKILVAERDALQAENERLRAFLEDIRSEARLTLAIWYDADELAESLGDVYRMADAALAKGSSNA